MGGLETFPVSEKSTGERNGKAKRRGAPSVWPVENRKLDIKEK
jgi:hypothetical protein